MKIGVDAREIQNGVTTGIGRALSNFIDYFDKNEKSHELILYSEKRMPFKWNDKIKGSVLTKISAPFWDQWKLPKVLAEQKIDLFYSPYYKIPLFTKIPVVNQILDLMLDLRNQMGASVILITHDLGLIAEMADRVAVMYAGQIIEQTDIKTLFAQPLHPYTVGLIESVPVLGQVKDRLAVIPGSVPNLIDMPPGCRFAPRCKQVMEICTQKEAELITVKPGHTVRCWLYQSSDQHWAPKGVE